VHDILPNTDVVVHPVPRAGSAENVFDRVRAVATRHNLNVHDVSIQDFDGRLYVEQHLELDETLPLKEAHDLASELESEIRVDVPEVVSILTHIESEPGTIESGEPLQEDAHLEDRLKKLAREFPEIVDVHDMRVKRVRDYVYVSCHCTFPDELALGRVHDVCTALEIRFKQEAPELFRVLIHPEPSTDNRR
jgi:divalent metal cation (Fe/Co/Zn/Cd) transporter